MWLTERGRDECSSLGVRVGNGMEKREWRRQAAEMNRGEKRSGFLVGKTEHT